MEHILFVNACTRPDSRTYDLAQHILSKLDGYVDHLRLYDEHIPPLDLNGMAQREASARAGDLSAPILRYALQFAHADTIVMAAPYWDLLFPAVVRTYLESVTVTGVTFKYTPEGIPAGLCRAKKLIYVTTAGGPIMDLNFGFDYVKALSQLYFGIPEVLCFTAEGLDIVGADVNKLMTAAKQTVDKAFGKSERTV